MQSYDGKKGRYDDDDDDDDNYGKGQGKVSKSVFLLETTASLCKACMLTLWCIASGQGTGGKKGMYDDDDDDDDDYGKGQGKVSYIVYLHFFRSKQLPKSFYYIVFGSGH